MSAQTGIVLFAHGSRDAQWAAPLLAIEAALRQARPEQAIRLAYLEIGQPDLLSALASLYESGVKHITLLPVFLGVGKHLRQDLPVLVGQAQRTHPDLHIALLPALGEHPLFATWVSTEVLGAVQRQDQGNPGQ